MERPLALIVDKDPAVRASIRDVFEESDVVALGAASGAEAMDLLRSRPVRIITIDDATPGLDIFGVLNYGMQLEPAPMVIGVIAATETERASELVRAGVADIWAKPLEKYGLRWSVQRALRHHGVLEELRRLRDELKRREGYHGMVGRSPQIERVRAQIQRLALNAVPVWFHGAIGTGKELAARTLQARANGEESPFVVVPCAGMDARSWQAQCGPEALEGLQGGALYLEDLPALDIELQSELVEMLEHAGTHVRIFCCSTMDPREATEQGRLLEELQRKMSVETIQLPLLRERVEDIPLLARHFITTICAINHLPPIELAPEALTLLEGHAWPENVQELRNAMEQGVILSSEGKIRPRDLPDRIREAAAAKSEQAWSGVASMRGFREAKREVVERFERAYLTGLLERHGGNVTAASHQAGMLRSALQRLLRKYELKSASFRQQHRAAGARDAKRPTR